MWFSRLPLKQADGPPSRGLFELISNREASCSDRTLRRYTSPWLRPLSALLWSVPQALQVSRSAPRSSAGRLRAPSVNFVLVHRLLPDRRRAAAPVVRLRHPACHQSDGPPLPLVPRCAAQLLLGRSERAVIEARVMRLSTVEGPPLAYTPAAQPPGVGQPLCAWRPGCGSLVPQPGVSCRSRESRAAAGSLVPQPGGCRAAAQVCRSCSAGVAYTAHVHASQPCRSGLRAARSGAC